MISLSSFLNKTAVLLLSGLLSLSACSNTRDGFKDAIIPEGAKKKIAVLPVENLSGTSAPLKEIRETLIQGMTEGGIRILSEESLQSFMVKYRVRYTGGVDGVIARALKEETGVQAVLITSLELYSDQNPPKAAITSRLVSTGDEPAILWMENAGMAGDDSPGILGLGLVEDPGILRKKIVNILSASLLNYLPEEKEREWRGPGRKFYPKVSYRSSALSPGGGYTVAVAPFFNVSDRKFAGEIMALHFVRQLHAFKNLKVIEPGTIRHQLLSLRMIMDEGISLADADALFSILDADLVVSGKVREYQDYQGSWGNPRIDFSVQLLERRSRQVVWSSTSYNQGDDGVFFFDRGRVNTAHAMASQMAGAIGKMLVK